MEDELLEALYNTYGSNRNVGTMRRAQLKKAQYQLMKQFRKNEAAYSDPKRFAIAPSFDENGEIQYGWEDFGPYLQSGMYGRILDAMREHPELGLNFYTSPRDFAMMTALREGVGWDDSHLYNPDDEDWNVMVKSPLGRNLLLWGEGILPEKMQTLVNDDILRKRRDASSIAGDLGQDAISVGAPVAGALAGGAAFSVPGAIVGGILGGAGGSLADDGIDYLRQIPEQELAQRLLRAEAEGANGGYKLPTDVNFASVAANDAPLSSPEGWQQRALINAGAGLFTSMLKPTAQALARQYGNLSNMMRVAALQGDNPTVRKELIFQGLHGASKGAGEEARQIAKYLEANGIKAPKDIPDDALNIWDRFVSGDNFDKMFSEPYKNLGIDEGRVVGTPKYQVEFGVPSLEEIAAAQRNATNRLRQEANENFVEGASNANSAMKKTIADTDREAADLIAAVGTDPDVATAFLPEAVRYPYPRQNVEPALGAVRQYLPEIRAGIASDAHKARDRSVGEASMKRSDALKIAPARGAKIGFTEANRDNALMMGADKGANKIIGLNPELFKALDLGHNQEYATALELFRLGQLPNNPVNQIFMKNSRRLLPTGEGSGLQPSITRLNKDKSMFASSGDPGASEGLQRMYNVKNFTWADEAGKDRTEDVLKATEQSHARRTVSRANVNPDQYAKHLKEGSVPKGAVKQDPDIPWYRKMGILKTKGFTTGADLLKLPVMGGGIATIRRLPQFIGNNKDLKGGD